MKVKLLFPFFPFFRCFRFSSPFSRVFFFVHLEKISFFSHFFRVFYLEKFKILYLLICFSFFLYFLLLVFLCCIFEYFSTPFFWLCSWVFSTKSTFTLDKFLDFAFPTQKSTAFPISKTKNISAQTNIRFSNNKS